MNIYLVNSDPRDLQQLKALINSDEDNVTDFQSGQALTHAFESNLCDLLIVDNNVNDISIVRLMHAAKKNHGYINWIPVIYTGVSNDADSIEQVMRLGADDYLSKPYIESILKAKIAAMKRVWHAQCELREQRKMLTIANDKLLEVVEKLQSETEQRKQAELLVKLQLKRLEMTNDKLSKLRKIEQHRALHDPLTQLANRSLLYEFIIDLIKKSERSPNIFALCIIDLDGFKKINDTHGHSYGDNLLVALSSRIKKCVRKSDLVARLGGDEFAIVLPEIKAVEDAGKISQEIINEIAKPYAINQITLQVTASIGIAVFPDDGEQYDKLSNHADIAMYTAKNSGKNQYAYHAKANQEASETRLNLCNDLLAAIDSDELDLYYQPVTDVQNDMVHSIECLIRWHRYEQENTPPRDFLPVATHAGIMPKVNEWTIRHACKRFSVWHKRNHALKLSLNVSSQQLLQANFIDTCLETLYLHNIPANHLMIELDERELDVNQSEIEQQLYRCSENGLIVVLDNCGSGLTSLRFLYELPLSYLKVDGQLVENCSSDTRLETIFDSVITITHSLGINIIAGRVESAAQCQYLKDRGITLMQGYFFSRPVMASVCDRMLVRSSE